MPRKAEEPNHYFARYPKSEVRLGKIRACFRGMSFEFVTSSGVFSKKRVDLGTKVLIESMVLPERGCVLDVGCGYGAVGIAAAAFNRSLSVILVDVNRRAVWLARQNIRINNSRNAEVKHGFLYEPVQSLSFESILSNPPVSAGMATVRAIVSEAPVHMTHGATLQMVVRSKIAGSRLLAFFEETFRNVNVLARESGYRVLLAEKR